MRSFEHQPPPAGQSPVIIAMINAIYGARLADMITFAWHMNAAQHVLGILRVLYAAAGAAEAALTRAGRIG